jgi:hypothetical protein
MGRKHNRNNYPSSLFRSGRALANGSTDVSCACGHSPEEHVDPDYPGSTSCEECPCIAYEAAAPPAGEKGQP